MTASGLIAQAGFAIETTVGTRVAPSRFVEFNSESLALQKERIERQGLRAGRVMHYGWSPGIRMVQGGINFDVSAETVGALFRAAIGGTPVTSTTGPPYVHTFTPGDLPSLTIQVGKPDVSGDVHPFDYVGCFVSQFTLSANPNEHLQMQLDITGKDELLDGTTATASYAQANFFTFVHGSLEIASSEVCIDSFSLTGDNALDVQHKICSTDAGTPTIREAGRRDYGGTFVADFSSLTQYQRYVNGTEAALSLEFEVTSSARLVIAGNVRFDGETPVVTGPEVLKQSSTFKFVSSTSDGDAFTATLTNTDATP